MPFWNIFYRENNKDLQFKVNFQSNIFNLRNILDIIIELFVYIRAISYIV